MSTLKMALLSVILTVAHVGILAVAMMVYVRASRGRRDFWPLICKCRRTDPASQPLRHESEHAFTETTKLKISSLKLSRGRVCKYQAPPSFRIFTLAVCSTKLQ